MWKILVHRHIGFRVKKIYLPKKYTSYQNFFISLQREPEERSPLPPLEVSSKDVLSWKQTEGSEKGKTEGFTNV